MPNPQPPAGGQNSPAEEPEFGRHRISLVGSSAPLTKVTVYRDRALLKRTLKNVSLDRGVNEVVFPFPPGNVIDGNSLRVTGVGNGVGGSAKATLVDISVSTKRYTRSNAAAHAQQGDKNDRIALLRQQVVEKKATFDAATKAVERARHGRQLICKWADAAVAPSFPPPPPPPPHPHGGPHDPPPHPPSPPFLPGSQVSSILESAEQLLTIADTKVTTTEANEQVASDALKEAELALSAATGSNAKAQVVAVEEATVTIEADDDCELNLEMSYMTSRHRAATWEPAYRLEVPYSGGGSEVIATLSYSGIVTQNTGEDWSGVELELSTAEPLVGAKPPALPETFVDVWQPQPVRSMQKRMAAPAMMRGGARGPQPMMMTAGAPPPPPEEYADLAEDDEPEQEPERMAAQRASSVVQAGASAATFTIAGTSTIVSGARSKVGIVTMEIPCTIRHVAIPQRSSDRVFTLATVSNKSQFELMPAPGGMPVFVDGAMVANARVGRVSPGERFEASLGVSPMIKLDVKRKRTTVNATMFSKLKGSGRDRVRIEEKIALKNSGSGPADVDIRARMPIASSDKVKVEMVSPTSESKIQEVDDSMSGVEVEGAEAWVEGDTITSRKLVSFKRTLQAGKAVTIDFAFDIEYPTGERITI